MKLSTKLKFRLGEIYINSMSAVEQIIHGVSLNPFSKQLHQDPYLFHSKMRDKSPIHYSMALKAYWVTSFDYVQEILLDNRFGANVRHFPDRVARITKNIDPERLESFNNPSMLDLDPPDHTRIRRLAQQGFVHKFIQSLEPNIRQIVNDCLDAGDNEQIVDIVEVLAKPLPAIVIADMLGLPKEDHDQFRDWSEDLIDGTSTNDPNKLERADIASRALIGYFRKIIRIKRVNPEDDMIGRLIRAEEEGDKLSEAELYNTCNLLLIAGHETTTRLISNGLYLLLTEPGHLDRLRQDPSLIPQAIEEMLRFEPPVQATRRFVLEDVDFHGTQLKRGELVFLSIAGSNRDPAANDEPDTFDPTREEVKTVSFGFGIHFCIGASLARLETRIAFEELFKRYPAMDIVDRSPHWGNNAFFRGHETLNVRVGPESTASGASA